MIIVLKADIEASHPEVRRLVALAESFPDVHTELHRIQGATRSLTEIYLLGRTGVIPTTPFEEFACVEKVVRITEKFRSIGRHGGGLDAVGFVRSPFSIDGKQRLFAEPPHMQASMLFVPSGARVPRVGEQVAVRVRFTATDFDHVVIS